MPNKRLLRGQPQFHVVRVPGRARLGSNLVPENYPVIVHPDHGVFEPASVFMRELAKWRSMTVGSLLDVAYIITAWCNHLEGLGLAWNEADEAVYHNWLTSELARGSIGKARQGRKATVIMRWYFFLASRDIGGPRLRSFTASISASPLSVQNLLPEARFKPPRGPKLKFGRRPIPDPAEVGRITASLASHKSPFVAERDWLLGSTVSQTGLRAMGLATMSCQMLDEMLRADGIIGRNDRIELMAANRLAKTTIRTKLSHLTKTGRENLIAHVTEKTAKTRSVAFPIQLALVLLDYVWGEREAHIRRDRHRTRRDRAAGHLWLSERSGRPLKRSSIKDILRMRGFVAAGVRGSGHSLRAAFLTDCACRLLAGAKRKFGQNYDAQAILLSLAEIAGHDDPITLRHYLDDARIRAALVGDSRFLSGTPSMPLR